MRKVMLVDDDAIILRGLQTTIDWEANNLELVGCAKDAIEGLELFYQHEPEIVVSDIKMPNMDGMEFCSIITRDYPGTKFILLSGHEDFAYAQKAIDMKVFTYLTKPAENAVILDAIKRATTELLDQALTAENIRESMPLLRQHFLLGLLRGHYTQEQIIRKAAFFQLALGKKHVAAILDTAHADQAQAGDMTENDRLELFLFSKEFLSEQDRCYAVNIGNDRLGFLHFSDKEDNIEIIEEMSDKLIRLSEAVKGSFGAGVIIGVGGVYEGIQPAPSYQEAKYALSYSHLSFDKGIIFYSDIVRPAEPETQPPQFSQRVESIIQYALMADAQRCAAEMELLKSSMRVHFKSLNDLRIVLLQIVIGIHTQSHPSGDSAAYVSSISQKVLETKNIDEMFACLQSYINTLCSELKEQREDRFKQVVHQAAQFIDLHFKDPDLGLKMVAHSIGISHTYLCVLFKRIMNIKFYDYLLQVRMEQAAKLLCEKDLKMYEVSDLVGFSNPQYFGTCFKKYYGKTISEYKRALQAK